MHRQDSLLPGVTFEERYAIITKIGEGGFGAVYKARQRTTGQLVALKIMRLPGEGEIRPGTRVARFRREARLCARLQHPHIVHLVDAGKTDDGRLYTVFVFAPGENLASLLKKERALSPRESRHLMLQLLDALACAHQQGVVHRDVKPSNIMVIATGARRSALLLDLGIGAMVGAKVARGPKSLTASSDVIGTPGYGAPEQWRGVGPSPRADLFSWGLVFLECLTGKPVYGEGTAAEAFYRQLGPDPVPIPAVLRDHPLGELILKATAKDETARDVTALGLFQALEACDVRDLSRQALLGLDSAGGADGPITLVSVHPRKAPQAPEIPSPRSNPAPSANQRRPLAAVCCQVTVSATAGSVDAEELDEVLRAHLARIGETAERHRGCVAVALGDRLLMVFGYPRAEENDVERAARAALDVTVGARTAAAELSRRGVSLQVRVGIHTGLATGDLTELGLSVGATPRAASRLLAHAPAGAVMVTKEAQRMLRRSFALEPAARHSSDSVANPGEVFHLLGEHDRSTLGPPGRSQAPLAGRTRELELLLEKWRLVERSMGQCSLIVGEPGIGKSRLAYELRQALSDHDHQFLEGRCSSDTQGNALQPIVDLLQRRLLLEPNRDPVGSVARLLAASTPRPGTQTLDALTSFFFSMAEKTPVLLLVEDLHWADPTTLELLAKILAAVESVPLCLLLTARPEFSPSFPTVGFLQLPLAPLDRSQIEAMVQGMLRRGVAPPGLVEHLQNRTDGVPLFVEELTQWMLDSNALVERKNGYELVGSLCDTKAPDSLRTLLGARLDRLERAKETAQWAAALEREFSVELLAALCPLGPAAVEEDLLRLMNAGLILRRRHRETPTLKWKHALVREVAYESLSASAKRAVHARIVETLEKRFPDVVRTRPALLALHRAAAHPGESASGPAPRSDVRESLDRAMRTARRRSDSGRYPMLREALQKPFKTG